MSITTTQLSPRPDLVPQVQSIGGTVTTFDIWNQTTAPLVVQLTRASWDVIAPGGRFQYLVSSLGGFPGWVILTPQQTASFSAASSQAIFLTTYQSGDPLPQCPAGSPTGNPPISFGSPFGPVQGLRQAGIQVYNVRDFHALGDGSTDDSGAIQKAFNAAAITGGIVELPPAPYAILSTLLLPSAITVQAAGATLKWIGATNSSVVSNASSAVLQNVVWNGGTIDAGNTSAVVPLLLQSPQICRFANLALQNVAGSLTPALFIDTAASGSPAPFGNNNAADNVFDHITVTSAPVALELSGTTGGTAVVTDNRFYSFRAFTITQIGIRFVQWADSNYFFGTWIALSGNNTTGILFNDNGTPSLNVGVYDNLFDDIAIDTFGNPTGVNVLTFNYAYLIRISGGFFGPLTAGVTFINDQFGQSYWVENLAGFNINAPYVTQKYWRTSNAGPAPTLGALQSGISSQTITPSGFQVPSDISGVLQVVTAGASPPAAGAAVAIITFANAFQNAPIIMLSNNGIVTGMFYATPGTSSFTVRPNTALTISTTYTIVWFVVGV